MVTGVAVGDVFVVVVPLGAETCKPNINAYTHVCPCQSIKEKCMCMAYEHRKIPH